MPNRAIIFTGALVLLYVAARVWRLTDGCLWFDEIFGVHAAEHSWGGMFWFVAQDLIHPPLFYVLLKLWVTVGGEGLLWLRLFPVFFSVLALFPFLHLCKELKLSTHATVLALAFFAVNGSLIKYAQEVRMYSVLLFMSLMSIWIFSRFFYRGKNIWVLTIINVLLVHTHYFGWLVVLSEIAAIAVLQRIKIRHVLLMAGIAAVSFVPWALTVMRAANAGSDLSHNIGWIKPPGMRALLELSAQLLGPFYFPVSSVDPATNAWISMPLIVLVGSSAVLWLVGRSRVEGNERVLFLAVLTLAPIVSAFFLSWASPYSVWGARHLIVVFAPVFVLCGTFIADGNEGKWRWVPTVAAAVLIFGAGVRYAAMQPQEQIWCAWGKLADSVPTEGTQTVYAFEDLSAYHLWFATRNRGNVRVVKVDGVPGMIEDKAYFLPRGFDGVRRIELGGIEGQKFWIAFRDLKWNEKHPPLYSLTEMGYDIGETVVIEAGVMKAFLVEVKRTAP